MGDYLAKYGSFKYGEELYGKTVNAGEAVLTPTGSLATSFTVAFLTVGEGIVSPVTTFSRKITLFRAVGEADVTSAGVFSRLLNLYREVGLAGTDPPLYGTFKYGERKYGEGTQQTPSGTLRIPPFMRVGQAILLPVSTFAREVTAYRSMGGGTITPVGRVAKLMFLMVGGGVVSSAGTLFESLLKWITNPILGCVRKAVEIKGRIIKSTELEGEVEKDEEIKGRLRK